MLTNIVRNIYFVFGNKDKVFVPPKLERENRYSPSFSDPLSS